MNSQASSEEALATLDLVFCVMDSPRRPLDFALLFHLPGAPSLEALRTGARSARNIYPTTGSYVDKNRWRRFAEPGDGITALAASSKADDIRAVEEFLDGSFDLRQQMPVQQLVVMHDREGGVKLVTRFHHAAADGLSAAMWLGHQLRVAYGREAPVAHPAPFQNLPLRSHLSPVKRSRFAYRGPAHRLWTPRPQPSRRRRWRTIQITAADLRERCRRTGGFTYNDLLATCALDVFARWNRGHGDSSGSKVGLWLPVNIRHQSSAGFGNGTGRIRLYARYAAAASLIEKCREIRRQVSWSNRHGEWAVPPQPLLTRLPLWAITPLLRCYLNRPWVDTATGVFSHAERWAGGDDEIFQHVERIECIGQLHTRHPVAINGVTHRGRTWLTFTYDPHLLSPENIECLVEMYQEQVALARRELS